MIYLVLIVFVAFILYMWLGVKPTSTNANPATRKYVKQVYSAKVLEVRIVGDKYDNRTEHWKAVHKNDQVSLRLEPNNPYDKNAIAVYSPAGNHLSYLPRNQRKLIRSIKEGAVLSIRVADKSKRLIQISF